MMSDKVPAKQNNRQALNDYYKFHSTFYDLTRWTFLFGRRPLVQNLPDLQPGAGVMEIGCGTGTMLKHLASTYPDAHKYGIDFSSDMLGKAEKKLKDTGQISLLNAEYGRDGLKRGPFDLILLSYSLTLTGKRMENIIQSVHHDLKPGGYIAVVDFHQTPFKNFRRWMKFNHVTLNGSILPVLNRFFSRRQEKIGKAYGGLWTYFQFIGQKADG